MSAPLPPPDQRYCINCKNIVKPFNKNGPEQSFICRTDQALKGVKSMVTGITPRNNCVYMRTLGACGPEGKLYK